MTDQMDPVDETTQYRRRIDDSIARFSAAHDEYEVEEAERRERRNRMTAGPAKLIEQTRTKLQRVTDGDDESESADAKTTSHRESAGKRTSGTRTAAAKPSGVTRSKDKKQQRNRRSVRTGQITACVLAVLVFVTTAAGWSATQWFSAQFNEVSALSKHAESINNGVKQRGDENFLIIGSDTRKAADPGDDIGTQAQVAGARSDTVMLVHIPKDRERVVVVSFLRDLEIDRPKCQRWNSKTGKYTDEIVPAATNVKLNTAYAVGGPKCLVKTIQQITHMRIHHFVGFNFDGFKAMVEAVGGVTIQSPRIVDSQLGVVVENSGKVTLEGQQALEYMRARKVVGNPTSGWGRIDRQQKFIRALLDRILSKEVLLNPDRLLALVQAFINNSFGDNIGVQQLLTLGQSLRNISPKKIEFMTVPTVCEANARGNVPLAEKKAEALFSALIHGRPLPEESCQSSKRSAAP